MNFKSAEISVKDAIKKVTEILPPKFENSLIDPELKDPRPNALIIINGKEINVLQGLQTMLHDGDEIVLLPVAHGGACMFNNYKF